MYAWESFKMLHAPSATMGPLVSMQDHYNLAYRREEREMLPLCPDQGIRRGPLEPAGPGPADEGVGHGHGRSETDEFGQAPVPRQRPPHRRGGGEVAEARS